MALAEWDLVGDEGDEVFGPGNATGAWRENPDFSSEARFARYKACPCPGVGVILHNLLDVDRLRLWVAHGCDAVVLALAIVEDLPLHLDLYLVLDGLNPGLSSSDNLRP